MKNHTLLFALAVQILLLFTQGELHAELLPYGNFEGPDLSDWAETNGAELVTDDVYQGSQAARIGWAELRGVVATVPGETYQVTGWVRILSESGSDWGGFRVRVSDFASWQELGAVSNITTYSHGSNWFPVSFTFVAAGTSARLQIGYFGGSGRQMTVNVDAFSIVIPGMGVPPVIESATLSPLNITSLPATQTFSVTATAPDGTIESVQWNFGDGGESTAVSGTRQVTAPGSFVARVTVYDNNGASAYLDIPWQATDPDQPVEPFTSRIRLDQFGYLPDAQKVAVIANPQLGFDSAESYVPGNVLEVRREDNGAVVFSGAPVAWNGGALHAQSGDRVWWFDFSAVTEPGEYRIHDPANQTASDRFRVTHDVYREVLRHAVRMFFYQRSGFAKEEPYAGVNWTDGASHPQDEVSRPIWDMGNAGLERDLRGGWYDAGDFNKYTEWTARAVVELLLAYQQRPEVFTDDFGIPESGNGIPDLLDEVRWGMDWLLRMQEPNGALLGKVSVSEHQAESPPSTDNHPRYYGPVSTEATAAGAAAFALGATVFESVGLSDYAATLEAAALSAWNWAAANPNVPFNNTGFASANPRRTAYETMTNRVMAAIMLFERTGNPVYRDFVDGNLMDIQPIDWGYFYPFEAEIQKALVHYTGLPGATSASVNTIRQRMASSINGPEFLQAWNSQTDAYRAYLKDADYVWGSNRVKSQVGTLFMNVNLLGLNPGNAAAYRNAAMGYLHYLHGVNPMGIVYLSNMYSLGATRSVNAMYHNWFQYGTQWAHVLDSPFGPPPGFLVGGPNRNYSGTLGWIRSQPIQKMYYDWNGPWPEDSWQITEPDINYQVAYIHLLSALMPAPVNEPPFFLSQPVSQTPFAGREVRLRVSVGGPTPVNYQWHGPNGPIANANSPELVIPSMDASDEGDYFVTVTNAFGTVTSEVATLSIPTVPSTERFLLNFGDGVYTDTNTWQNFRLRQTAGTDSAFRPHGNVILQNTAGAVSLVTFSVSSTISGDNVGQNIPLVDAFVENPFAWFNTEAETLRATPAFNHVGANITYTFDGFDPEDSVTFELVIRRTTGVRNVTFVVMDGGGEPVTLLDNADSAVTRFVTHQTSGFETYHLVLTSNTNDWVASINAMSVLVERDGAEADPFDAWWAVNAVFFEGHDSTDSVVRQGVTLPIRDIWIAGLEPDSDELFQLSGLNADGLPAFDEKPGRQYRIRWTDDLSIAPENWNILKDFHEPFPVESPDNDTVFYLMDVRIE